MHENENNVMRPRTRTRPTKRGRERERELKTWPRDHVGLENLTSLLFTRATLCYSAVFATAKCPSVRPDVCHTPVLCLAEQKQYREIHRLIAP